MNYIIKIKQVEQWNEVKIVWGKEFLLMRDNSFSHMIVKPPYQKNKDKKCKDWQQYNLDLNLIEDI